MSSESVELDYIENKSQITRSMSEEEIDQVLSTSQLIKELEAYNDSITKMTASSTQPQNIFNGLTKGVHIAIADIQGMANGIMLGAVLSLNPAGALAMGVVMSAITSALKAKELNNLPDKMPSTTISSLNCHISDNCYNSVLKSENLSDLRTNMLINTLKTSTPQEYIKYFGAAIDHNLVLNKFCHDNINTGVACLPQIIILKYIL